MNRKLDGWRPEGPGLEHFSYGLIRDKLRDATRDLRVEEQALFGMASDLRSFSSPRFDQKDTNSCVAASLVKALEIKRIQKYGRDAHVDLSVLEVYYLARELESPDAAHEDNGSMIYLGAEVLRRFGVCTEAAWPFNVDRRTTSKVNTPPTWSAMRSAYTHKITAWHRIDSIEDDRVADVIVNLAAGNPVVFGCTVGDNWLDYKKGEVLWRTENVRGRHATVLVGWQPDLHGGVFIGENSWSSEWGDDGFYLLDPAVVASSDSAEHTVILAGFEEYAK